MLGDQCPPMIMESHGSCTCIYHSVFLFLTVHVVRVEWFCMTGDHPERVSERVFHDRLSVSNISHELVRSYCFIPRSLEAYWDSNTYFTKLAVLQHRCMLYHYATAVTNSINKFIWFHIMIVMTIFCSTDNSLAWYDDAADAIFSIAFIMADCKIYD